MRDERGLETLQVVMILAIAAVCLLLVQRWWPTIKQWYELAVGYLIEN